MADQIEQASADFSLSFWQACSSQTLRECSEIVRSVDRKPIREIGDAERGIKLAQTVHRFQRFVRSAGKCMACRDDADHHQEARQIPE